MTYYGLASHFIDEAIELYATREAAEQAVRTVIEKTPELANDVFVAEVELPEPSPN